MFGHGRRTPDEAGAAERPAYLGTLIVEAPNRDRLICLIILIAYVAVIAVQGAHHFQISPSNGPSGGWFDARATTPGTSIEISVPVRQTATA